MPVGASRRPAVARVRTGGMVLIDRRRRRELRRERSRDSTSRAVRPTRDVAGTADSAPGTARLTWRVGGALGRCVHVDPIGPVVTRPAVGRASAPAGVIRLAPAERHPAVERPAAVTAELPNPGRRTTRRAPAPRRDARRSRPDTSPSGRRYERPAAVMERRISPRRAVDPRRSPAADLRPVAVAIRRPVGRDGVRKPDGAVFRSGLPRPVAVEIRGADHLPRHVGRRAQRLRSADRDSRSRCRSRRRLAQSGRPR